MSVRTARGWLHRRAYAKTSALLLIFVFAPLRAAPLPPVDRVAFSPPAGASLPLDARFTDETGHPVRLGDYLRHSALVVPAYYGCSNLCGVVLSGLAASLAAAGPHAGRDVQVVVASISPLETPADALAKKRAVLGDADGNGDRNWHFLTGEEASIDALTRALGYRDVFVPAERQYAHAAGIAVVAPDGSVARVLYGVSFPPRELEQALAAATDPPVAHPVVAGDVRDWLLCFHYDPRTGRYSFAAMTAVRIVGMGVLLALVAYAARARWRESTRSRETREEPR